MSRIFLSHRIDFLSVAEALSVAESYRNISIEFDSELISMAFALEEEVQNPPSDEIIVEKCLAALKTCDVVIFDCSEEDWTYIGCIFEVVYAVHHKIPVFAYIGDTSHGKRPWLRYHCRGIYSDRFSLKNALRVHFRSGPTNE